MKVTITTSGSRGDVQPYVALGLGLAESGHEVTLAAPTEFDTLVRSRGLDFVGVDANPRETTERMLREGTGIAGFARSANAALKPVLVEMLESYTRACARADIVLYTPVGFFGHTLSVHMGLPRLGCLVQPLFQGTGQFPSPLARPLGDDFGGVEKSRGAQMYNQLTHQVTEQLLWQALRGSIQYACERVLGYRPYSLLGPFGQMQSDREASLLGWSPSVLPRPSKWPPERNLTGHWFLPADPTDEVPPDLKAFVEEGPPPISIGFGSMNDPRAPGSDSVTQVVLDAVRRSGQRAVLLTGWAGLSSHDLPDGVFALEQAPHEWLFDKVSVAVHHGGAGTTAASLRAGKPTVTVPFFADQPFWGARVAQLGVGPEPIPIRKLTAGRLSDAILRAVGDGSMRRRAADLGRSIRRENGVGEAVSAFNQYVDQPARAGNS
jgi:UDP:flavonoid glycosyltransferase YjiC (YdhE family)